MFLILSSILSFIIAWLINEMNAFLKTFFTFVFYAPSAQQFRIGRHILSIVRGLIELLARLRSGSVLPLQLFLGEEAATAAPPPRPTTQTQKGFI